MLHQVGSGVLGPVFRASDPDQDRLIAVKALTLDIIPEDVVRLVAELRRVAAVAIDHPAVVPVCGAGAEGGRAYLATEYVAGESFDIAARHLAPATLERALPLLTALAGAIDAAWAVGLGHGALHPRDIFVVPHAPGLRVTGIGVVPALERIGVKTPVRRPYTAPERSEGRQWDLRADVYSLGAIAHELLAGRRMAATADQESGLPAVADSARAAVRQVLSRALAVDPARRFASGAEFVQALEAAAAATIVAPEAPEAIGTSPPATTEAAAPRPPVQDDDLPVPAIDDMNFRTGTAPAAPAVDVVTRRPEPADTRAVAMRSRARASPYPWAAIAAVAIAGVTLGGVGGYVLGRNAGARTAVTRAEPARGAAETEVAVAPPEVAPPASTPTDARPVVRISDPDPGRIVVRSQPAGALVMVDGRHAGETPTTVTDLSLGAHTLVIARPGYVPRTERVTLTRGTTSRAIAVELRPGVDVRSAQLGSVYVDSRPRGARVTIDGRFVGVTPLSLIEISPGDHRVEVALESYLAHTGTVRVTAGEQARVTVSLARGDRR